MANIRVLRIMEYVGDEESIWRTLDSGAVPINGKTKFGDFSVKSGIVGRAENFDYVSKYLGEEPTDG